MVKQKCLYKVLLHRNSDIFYFSETRNQCNGETEMFCFEEVLLHKNSDIFYFSATRNQCNSETEMSSQKFCFIGSLIPSLSLQQEINAMVKQKCLYKVLLHRYSDTFYLSATRNQRNGETEISLKSLISQYYDIVFFSATRNQCNGETEMFYFEEVLLHRNSDIFLFHCNKKSVQW